METIKVKLRFVEGLLGTASANKEIHEDFIKNKHPEKENGGGKDEIETLPDVDDELQKSMTVFNRDEDGTPMLFDYQIKGFFKDSIRALMDCDGSPIDTKERQKKLKLTAYTYKRTVDNLIFVTPRRIRLTLPEGKELTHCQRPLRAETMRGERVALANSEEAPAGTTAEFTVAVMNKALLPVIRECLEYGSLKGIGQWRNSGKGRFELVHDMEEEAASA